jgi:hypothetical protein
VRHGGQRIVTGVADLMRMRGDSQIQVRYSVAGQSRGRVTLCAICTVHEETRSMGFLVEPQNQGQRFAVVWPQNHWDDLSVVWPQNHYDDFLRFDLKTDGNGFS